MLFLSPKLASLFSFLINPRPSSEDCRTLAAPSPSSPPRRPRLRLRRSFSFPSLSRRRLLDLFSLSWMATTYNACSQDAFTQKTREGCGCSRVCSGASRGKSRENCWKNFPRSRIIGNATKFEDFGHPRGLEDRKNSFSLERMKKTIPPRTKFSFSIEIFILGLKISFSIENFNPRPCFSAGQRGA